MSEIEEKAAEEPQEYVIKFIPSRGEVMSLRLPARLLKYGLGSLAALSVLFVVAVSFAVYSTFTAREGASEISELRSVNNIQQEQLLQLSRKANSLQDQLDQLETLEAQIRRQTGLGASEAGSEAQAPVDGVTHDGQGGPFVEPDLKNVGIALDEIEKRVAARRNSLLALQQSLKEQQAMAVLPVGSLTADSLGVTGLIGGPSITTPSMWPCTGEVSSPYGLRWGGSDFHPGIDIADDMGTPIVATADGVVDFAGWNSGGYGNMVDIDHGNGIMTRYAHAMQVVVVSGQQVRRGQVIAYMGSTGFSTGPHCHYEVRIEGQAVNPATYLY